MPNLSDICLARSAIHRLDFQCIPSPSQGFSNIVCQANQNSTPIFAPLLRKFETQIPCECIISSLNRTKQRLLIKTAILKVCHVSFIFAAVLENYTFTYRTKIKLISQLFIVDEVFALFQASVLQQRISPQQHRIEVPPLERTFNGATKNNSCHSPISDKELHYCNFQANRYSVW